MSVMSTEYTYVARTEIVFETSTATLIRVSVDVGGDTWFAEYALTKRELEDGDIGNLHVVAHNLLSRIEKHHTAPDRIVLHIGSHSFRREMMTALGVDASLDMTTARLLMPDLPNTEAIAAALAPKLGMVADGPYLKEPTYASYARLKLGDREITGFASAEYVEKKRAEGETCEMFRTRLLEQLREPCRQLIDRDRLVRDAEEIEAWRLAQEQQPPIIQHATYAGCEWLERDGMEVVCSCGARFPHLEFLKHGERLRQIIDKRIDKRIAERKAGR